MASLPSSRPFRGPARTGRRSSPAAAAVSSAPLDEVARCLAPVGVDRFLADVWGRTHVYIPGSDERFEHLLPWTAFSRILEQHRLDFPRLRLVKAGRPLTATDYRVYERNKRGEVVSRLVPENVCRALRDGATLVVDSIDETYEPLRRMASAFERIFSTTVRINAYFSEGDEAGFLPHWDDHEVLVLQVHGRKRWKVFGTNSPHPLRQGADGDGPPADTLWEGSLRAGDVLYLPRGCWHAALPEREPTLHLSVGIHNRTGLDFVEWLHGRLRANECFRRDLPVQAGRDAQQAHAEQLLARLNELWRPEMVFAFLDEARPQAAARPSFDLPLSAPRATSEA